MSNRVTAEVDLGALRHNIAAVRRFVGPHPRLMAVVKANAYGLGAAAVARAAIAHGCSALAVNDVEEALELRAAGVQRAILVLGPLLPCEIPEAVEHDLAVTLHGGELVDALHAEARRQCRFVRVHLKIDTGLTRLGAAPDEALAIAWAVSERPHLALEAVYTHLSSAVSGDATVTRGQLDRFHRVLRELDHAGLRPPVVHAANSAALFAVPESRYDLVRPGIALYGMDPGLFSSMGLDLRPMLALRTRVAHLHAVDAGTTVGYEQTWRAERGTVVATCAAGYDDGYPWALGNRGRVIVRGRRAPIVGRVSMNWITVDVGDIPGVAVGDEVTLVGRDGSEEIRVEELARLVGTIPYELTCRLGRRVERVYTEARQKRPTVKLAV